MENEIASRRLKAVARHFVHGNTELGFCNAQSEGPLDKERRNPSFDVRQLTYLLDGGEQYTLFKETVASVIESDPILRDDHRYDLTRPEAREITMAKVKRVAELWNKDVGEDRKQRDLPRSAKTQNSTEKAVAEAFWYVMSLYDPSWATRIGVHFGLFFSAIQGQGTEEQIQKYQSDVQSMKILGCFAMTELGHGSYIRGFETTAIYEKSTQEFIINSPTETSTKWWIGMAGQTATHSVCFARLLIDDVDYGVHSFIVPLRNPETGIPFSNISIGDCGAKMGRNGLDNGWIQYHNVRVPRENMLMRWAKVSPDGIYTKPPKAQLSYGALIGGRVGMIMDSSDYAKKALTIAIRYSAVRRQFPSSTEDGEEQILNYQTQQYRLLPILAACFAYHFTGLQIREKFEKIQNELEEGNISNLVGIHATSAGLKAFSTWWCTNALEQCRQSLGGHGYSAYSGLPALLNDFAVMCTWEGDNTVMAQQCAKFLMKTVRKNVAGMPLVGFEAYLADIPNELGSKPLNGNDLLNHSTQLEIMKRLAIKIISQTSYRLEKERAQGKSKSLAWNECMQDAVNAARVHCDFFVISCFVDAINSISSSGSLEGVKTVLTKLCNLYALITIDRYSPHLLENNLFNSENMIDLHVKIRELIKDIRKDAVPLVDSFNFPDFVLNSPLGRYDGQVYTHYLDTVKKAPNSIGKAPYWDTLIAPCIKGSKEQLPQESIGV